MEEKSYNLRPEGGIRKPERFRSEDKDVAKEWDILKRKRAGKKGLITRKIKQIQELISENGSRTKISYLKGRLNEVLQEATRIHEHIMELSDGTTKFSEDDGWLEDVTYNVDTCNSDVNEYLESRRDEPPSENRSITSWLQRCENEERIGEVDLKLHHSGNTANGNMSDLANDLDKLTLRTREENDENSQYEISEKTSLMRNRVAPNVTETKIGPTKSLLNPEVKPYVHHPYFSSRKDQFKAVNNEARESQPDNYYTTSAGMLYQRHWDNGRHSNSHQPELHGRYFNERGAVDS